MESFTTGEQGLRVQDFREGKELPHEISERHRADDVSPGTVHSLTIPFLGTLWLETPRVREIVVKGHWNIVARARKS